MKNQDMARSAKLRNYANMLKTLGEVMGHPEIPMHSIEVLLLAAAAEESGEPMDSRELARITGLSPSAISRNLSSLGEHGQGGRSGMNLLTARPDPQDRRRKPVRITHKGRMTVNLLVAAFEAPR